MSLTPTARRRDSAPSVIKSVPDPAFQTDAAEGERSGEEVPSVECGRTTTWVEDMSPASSRRNSMRRSTSSLEHPAAPLSEGLAVPLAPLNTSHASASVNADEPELVAPPESAPLVPVPVPTPRTPGGGERWGQVRAVVHQVGFFRRMQRIVRSDHPNQFNHPRSQLRRYWNAVQFGGAIYNAILVPMQVSFDIPLYPGLVVVDYLFDFIFWVEIAWHFVLGFIDWEGTFQLDLKRIRDNYVKGEFIIDALAALPIDLFVWYNLRLHAALRLNRLIRMYRISEYFRWWAYYTPYASALRLCRVFTLIFLLAHLVSCVLNLVLTYEVLENPDFMDPNFWSQGIIVFTKTAPTVHNLYPRCLYWSLSFLTSFGANYNFPNSQLELWFSLVCLLCGIVMLSSVIGQVGTIISQMNASEMQFRERMDEVNAWLKFRRLPDDVSLRVRGYYEYIFLKQQGIDDAKILNDFPSHLRRDVSLAMHQDILKKVDFFRYAPQEFLQELVLKLVPQIFAPEDHIVRTGEVGNCMYFLKSGTVRVQLQPAVKDGPDAQPRVVNQLFAGEFFGEIAVLNNSVRSADCVADTFVDTLVLLKVDVDEAMRQYPEVAAAIRAIAAERLHKDAVRNQEYQAKKEQEKMTQGVHHSHSGHSGHHDHPKLAVQEDGEPAPDDMVHAMNTSAPVGAISRLSRRSSSNGQFEDEITQTLAPGRPPGRKRALTVTTNSSSPTRNVRAASRLDAEGPISLMPIAPPQPGRMSPPAYHNLRTRRPSYVHFPLQALPYSDGQHRRRLSPPAPMALPPFSITAPNNHNLSMPNHLPLSPQQIPNAERAIIHKDRASATTSPTGSVKDQDPESHDPAPMIPVPHFADIDTLIGDDEPEMRWFNALREAEGASFMLQNLRISQLTTSTEIILRLMSRVQRASVGARD